MNEQHQCDDFFIPAVLLKLPRKPETSTRRQPEEDFLQGIQGWADNILLDECFE